MALIAWYPLNGDTLDYSGNELHATANGPTTSSVGKIGGSYSFNRDFITTPIKFLKNNSYSITFWLYEKESINTKRGVNISLGGTPRLWIVFGARRITMNTYYGPGNGDYWHNGTYAYNYGEWVHVSVIVNREKGVQSLYVNGELHSSRDTNKYTEWPDSTLKIGSSDNNVHYQGFIGNLNDIRVYNHPLNAKEVKEISLAKVLHYKFNDDSEGFTENVLVHPDLDVGWSKGYCEGIQWNDIDPPQGIDSEVLSFYNKNGSTGYLYSYGDYAPQIPGRVYTASVYVRTNDSNFRITVYTADNSETGRYWSERITVPNDGQWHRVVWKSFKNAENSMSDSMSFHFLFGSDKGESQRTWICAPQLEEGDSASSFTKSTYIGSVKDSSFYNHTGTFPLGKAPKWSKDSKIGNGSLNFNGENVIQTRKIFTDKENQNHTVSAWVFPTDPEASGNQQLVNFNRGYRLYHTSDGSSLMYINSGVNDHYVYGTRIPSQKWTLVTWVYSKEANICKVYYDGKLNRSSHFNFQDKNPFGFSEVTVFGENFYGLIDDIRIYATALSESDVLDLYEESASLDSDGNLYIENLVLNDGNSEIDINSKGQLISSGVSNVSIADGLVGWWPLDGNTKDMFGENDGVALNSTSIYEEPFNSFYFNGSNSTISTNFYPSEAVLSKNFTWSFWKKYNVLTANTGSSGNKDTGTTRFYTQIDGGGSLRAAIGDWFGTVATIEEIDSWHHIVFLLKSGDLETYINGKLVNIKKGVNFSGRSSSPFVIGSGFEGARFHNGFERDVRIYNRALSAKEVEILYKTTNNSETKMEFYNNKVYITGDFKEV